MLLRTNTNKYKNNFKKELNACLLNNGCNYCENINDLLLCFHTEYNHSNNKKMFPNLQIRISEFLQGLPYGFNFGYRYQILHFAAACHGLDKIPSEKEDIIIKNFYNHCAFMLLKLGSKQIIEQLY